MTPAPLKWSVPVSYLPRQLLEPRNPLVAILVGWLTALIPDLLVGAVVTRLFPHLGQPQLPPMTPFVAVLVAVISPVIETLIMAGLLSLLLKVLPPTYAVLVSAVGWGIAHSLAAPAWGLVVWWLFLVFSVLYVTWRSRSLALALAVPAATHMLQNSLPVLVLAFGGKLPG